MSVYRGLPDFYVKAVINALLQEARNDHLADQLASPSRSVRIRLAERLRAAAQWIEGTPQLASA